jgi:hypothetical protein
MVLQCINGVGSNPVEGRTKLNQTVLELDFRAVKFIYIYISNDPKSRACDSYQDFVDRELLLTRKLLKKKVPLS